MVTPGAEPVNLLTGSQTAKVQVLRLRYQPEGLFFSQILGLAPGWGAHLAGEAYIVRSWLP